MLKAVIFDFDGVIADTEPLHYISTNQVLQLHGLEITREDFYNNYLGYSDHDFFEMFREKFPKQLGSSSIQTLMRQKTDAQLALIDGRDIVIKGVPELLEMLSGSAILVAICSGGRRGEISQILTRGSLAGYFKIIVSADEVKIGKPDPEGYLLTLKQLAIRHPGKNIEANDCVVIEDSRWGIEAAKSASMKTIAVATSYSHAELSRADVVVDKVSDITLAHLRNLCEL
jgi:beta-phosphoglucomutase